MIKLILIWLVVFAVLLLSAGAFGWLGSGELVVVFLVSALFVWLGPLLLQRIRTR